MELKEFYETKYAYCEIQNFHDYERNRALVKVVKKYLRPKMKILDIGCNDGVVAEYLLKQGLDVAGFDISQRALDLAGKRGLTNLHLGDIHNGLPFNDSSFDAIFWGDNIEHLFDPEKTLNEISRILKNGGLVILSTPNMGWVVNRVYYFFAGMPRRTEGHRNPPWLWEHIRFFNNRVIKQLLNETNFEIVNFTACDRRKVFSWLCNIAPSLFGSIMIVTARKNK